MDQYYTGTSYISSLIDSLVIFRGVAEGDVLSKLRELAGETRSVRSYSAFIQALYRHGCNFSEYLLDAAAKDENIYVHLRAKGKPIPRLLMSCLKGELQTLQMLSSFTSLEFKALTNYSGYLPDFETSKLDFAAEYEKRIADISTVGYGIYADNVMFRLDGDKIVPITTPDPVSVNDLIGYELQRSQVIANTEALIKGLPAANVLLVGDAGTGKSTTVKAVVNLLADRGVRLIELKKQQLRRIPAVMEELRDNPLKFILFIDDLSFSKNDDNFSSLKAILEGSATVRADNTVIYATSNRRHLVKESFSDREGDDVHLSDTLQEINSLADRFGLTILYTKPNKQLYLDIVRGLCENAGIEYRTGTTDIEAGAFAVRKGGFTPRAAEQFVDSLISRGTGM